MKRASVVALLCAIAWVCLPARAQTSQATLSGEVRDAQGQALAGVRVYAENEETGVVTTAETNSSGQYVLPFLSRGRYVVRVQAPGFRPLERRGIELHVAERATADVQLDPMTPDQRQQAAAIEAGVLARGGIALVYGPDAQMKLGVVDDRPPPMTDATSSTVSTVIDEQRLHELPLGGRNIYTLFVLLPGVTSDNATQRGLGFSVNGFRVSSANYLLDGVDNNNVLNSADVTALSPDAVHEYRIATKNFTAEYGRGAFVANVVTRSGGNQWHGGVFEFLLNELLSANSFQDNAAGRRRPPFKEHQFGYLLGGPVKRDRLFVFTSLEGLKARTADAPQRLVLPSPSFIARASGPVARALFDRFPLLPYPATEIVDADRVATRIARPVRIDTLAASARVDYELRPGRDRVFFRFGSLDQTFDNAVFSPYRGLSVPLVTAARNIALGHIHRFSASVVNEAKLGMNRGSSDFRPAAEGVPELVERDTLGFTVMPGNVDSGRDQSYADTLLHAVENLSVLRGRHHLVAGGEFRPGWSSSLFAPGRLGRYIFTSMDDFAADRPAILVTSVDRFADPYRAPDFTRQYRQSDAAAFVQDNWRATPRLTLNLGLRWEFFGAPRNRHGDDVNFFFGSGSTTLERVASGTLRPGVVHNSDRNNFAPRFGAAFDLLGNTRTILRGGYGVYYDRTFNLLWDPVRRNDFVQAVFQRETAGFGYGLSATPALPPGPALRNPEPAFGVDVGLRTPYVHTWFGGIQQALGRDTVLEVTQSGSLGRKLPAADVINRTRVNATLGEVSTVGSQGSSSFLSLETSIRRRFHRGLQLELAHTWSHAIDNQGDPLIVPGFSEHAFQREFDSAGDRGNAEYDQRHNVVIHGLWQSPRLAGGWGRALGSWQVAGLAGFRTGFPFSVIALPRSFVASAGPLVQSRADFVGGNYRTGTRTPVPGGRTYLDRSRFEMPEGRLGNTGRNAFRGPGFWNVDLSIARELGVRHLGENGRLQFRAEFFNALNHANLGQPDNRLFASTFGEAAYGRRGFQSLLVGTSPLNEFPRRIQLALRLMF